MTDEKYREMVIDHDKHLDSLTQSVSVLADNVKTTNNKLDNVIDVIQAQNVLTERLSNLDINFKDSFNRVHTKIEHLEESVEKTVSTKLLYWFLPLLFTYIIAFGTYVVKDLQSLRILAVKEIQMQRQINLNVNDNINKIRLRLHEKE